mgnify:CR=1 FL=1
MRNSRREKYIGLRNDRVHRTDTNSRSWEPRSGKSKIYSLYRSGEVRESLVPLRIHVIPLPLPSHIWYTALLFVRTIFSRYWDISHETSWKKYYIWNSLLYTPSDRKYHTPRNNHWDTSRAILSFLLYIQFCSRETRHGSRTFRSRDRKARRKVSHTL